MPNVFLPYAKPSLNKTDLEAVTEALKGELITRGPPVQLFEQTIADSCNARYAVAFNSGSSALSAAYFAAQLTSYDRVLSTPNSFIATVAAPFQMGCQLEFADLDCRTGNLALPLQHGLLDFHSTRGRLFIVPVHFAGLALDMAALKREASPKTILIEDAAHALGSLYPTGEKVGSCVYSQMTIFSFHPAKTLTTGEGGMVTTNDPDLYHRLQLYRDSGIERQAPYLSQPAPGYYEVQAVTGNFNFTSFQAALGLSQFQRLESFITKRRALVAHYRKRLASLPYLTLFTEAQDAYTAFHLFVVQINFKAYNTTREAVMLALKEQQIGSQMHYIPLYHHPVFKNKREFYKEKLTETERYYAQALSLPLYPELTERDIDRVCRTLKKILQKNK